MRRLTFFIACLGFSSSNLCAAPISFVEAWQMVQQDNHSLAAQRANVERYQHLQNASSAKNWPSITLGANYTRLDNDITLSGQQIVDSSGQSISIPASVASSELGAIISSLGNLTSTITEQDVFGSSIRAIWPIFTGGRISAAQQAAESKKMEAQSELAMEVQARFEDLSKYYFSVLLAQDVLNTRHLVVQGLTRHYHNAIKLEQQGQIAHVERLQAQAALDRASVEHNKARNNLKIAQSALTQILNQVVNVEPGDRLFTNANLPPLTAFVDQTLANYPGLSILDAKEQQARSLIKAEQGKYYPNVYLYGDYSLYEDDSLASQLKPDWLVGIGVSIPLIDNSGRSDNVAAAQSAVKQVRHKKAQAKQDLNVLVQKTYYQAEQAQQEVQGLASSIELAQENLTLRQKAFAQGVSTSTDVVDAELNLASVKTQRAAAKYNYVIALSRLLALSNEMDSFAQYQSTPAITAH